MTLPIINKNYKAKQACPAKNVEVPLVDFLATVATAIAKFGRFRFEREARSRNILLAS